MILCLLIAANTQVTRPVDQVQASTLAYWTETYSLFAFGVARIVAGNAIPALVDEDEMLKLS
jgi:hypothetical protein